MLTRRDVEIVDWIGRLGAAGVEDVMRRFEMSCSRAYRRVWGLTRDGLLESRRVLHMRPGSTSPRARGCACAGSRASACAASGSATSFTRGRSRRPRRRSASASAALGVGLGDWRLLAEREIRMLEADRSAPAFSAVVGSLPGGRPVLHRPDLAGVSPDGRVIVVEVELTVKAPQRLATICGGWARARGIDAVYYLASRNAARALARAVAETRAEDRITVLPLEAVETLVDIETTNATAAVTATTTGQVA